MKQIKNNKNIEYFYFLDIFGHFGHFWTFFGHYKSSLDSPRHGFGVFFQKCLTIDF